MNTPATKKAAKAAKAAKSIPTATSGASNKVVRLEPRKKTLRRLYALSGNRCAFYACERAILNIDGIFVAQVCHIEAASPEGQRFNAAMTNEQRAHEANLLLLCYEHHRVTDDVTKYPVERMQQIKRDHEAKFADAAGKIRSRIVDHTTLETVKEAANLEALWAEIGAPADDDHDPAESLAELGKVVRALKRLPIQTRQLFAIAVDRSKIDRPSGSRYVSVSLLKLVTELSMTALRNHIAILDEAKLVGEADPGEQFREQRILIQTSPESWDFWTKLKKFCKKESCLSNYS